MAHAALPQAAGVAADLRAVFADRLRSVVAYGPRLEGHDGAPLSCLALVSSLTIQDLERCAAHAAKWQRAGVATPLILPEQEFARSFDAFPLEYGEILRAHQHIYGADPFQQVSISRDDLRRACETQVKSHLMHLREGFIEAGGQPRSTGELVTASAPAFAALLRNVARLFGVDISDRATATLEGARAAGLPEGVVAEVLALERPTSVPVADPARLFPEYLAAVEQLSRTVDQWRA